MAAYQVVYSDIVVYEDLPRLGTADSRRIEKIIRTKLFTAPDQFGKPLRRPYHGYWVLRSGHYRIAYAISKNIVRILAILPRDRIYQELFERLSR